MWIRNILLGNLAVLLRSFVGLLNKFAGLSSTYIVLLRIYIVPLGNYNVLLKVYSVSSDNTLSDTCLTSLGSSPLETRLVLQGVYGISLRGYFKNIVARRVVNIVVRDIYIIINIVIVKDISNMVLSRFRFRRDKLKYYWFSEL